MKTVAILGASGHIGISLSCAMLQPEECFDVYLFSRSSDGLKNIESALLHEKISQKFHLHTLEDFNSFQYDVIINATGVSDLASLKDEPSKIVTITESMDERVMLYLTKYPHTKCIMMSSGAVYNAPTTIEEIKNVNGWYAYAKSESEKRNRARPDLSIVDVRVFSFFSHCIDTRSHFLMAEIVACLQDGSTFVTNDDDIVRDYITPVDLLSLIQKIMEAGVHNDYFDAYSAKPVTKFELLTFLQKMYGLKVDIKKTTTSKTGLSSNVYYSTDRKAETIGYAPTVNSLEGIDQEIKKLLL